MARVNTASAAPVCSKFMTSVFLVRSVLVWYRSTYCIGTSTEHGTSQPSSFLFTHIEWFLLLDHGRAECRMGSVKLWASGSITVI